ncbi:MAG TPA: hypothetical protein VHM65_00005, partial [Candidatus Lustribacter sp.]|nr:hypothetical protein [Candidatus Lustribacter sp.]
PMEDIVCGSCGRTPGESDRDQARARLAWARSVENSRTVWTCDRCARTHLRSIEGKLDSTWW